MNGTYLHRMTMFPAERMETLDDALADLTPMILGMRRQVAPPVFLGGERLQRMHVLVVNRINGFPTSPASDDLEQILPRLSRWPVETETRPVLGEILRGERGEWYERIGQRIRPLRQLVSGPDGEVLEVPAILMPAQAARRASRPQPPHEDEARFADSARRENASPPSSGEQPECVASPPFRTLLAEPGAWRVVMLGPFKPILGPQLTEPSRLRDMHRLPCHVQIFEAAAPQRIETLVRAIQGENAGMAQLQPLTPAVVAQLELAPLLPAPPNIPPFTREPGHVLPGHRFFRLTLASDPTAKPRSPSPPPAAARPEAVATPQSAPRGQDFGIPAHKTDIPIHLLRPWEFCRTREEAIFRLHGVDSLLTRIMRPIYRLLHRASYRRWQVLLSGRSAEEQLWMIPPPRGWRGDPWIREWAKRTLEIAGYNSRTMLAEWEILWHRKQL